MFAILPPQPAGAKGLIQTISNYRYADTHPHIRKLNNGVRKLTHVRLWLRADIKAHVPECPLIAISGHE